MDVEFGPFDVILFAAVMKLSEENWFTISKRPVELDPDGFSLALSL